ncbi:MAG: MptD family putative ECF transporter S component [Propionibacteriaceae bacterium]|nr:MptD family putative ECF transporter S component [Propionibacteriaceae bacterium]
MSDPTKPTTPESPTPQRKSSLVRDAVTIGIFVALYIVLFFICGTTMGAIPLIMVLLPVIFGIFGGLIFTVLLGKVQRAGIFLITGVIIGVMMISMAPGGIMCYMTIAGGVVAEVIYWLMGRKSFASMVTAYTAFVTLFAIGEYIPFIWMKDAYLKLYENSPTLDVAKAGMDMLNPTTMVIYCLLAVVACIVGCFWGRALTRKQFARAGII